MSILFVLAVLVLGLPFLSYGQYLSGNARAGQLPQIRALCRGRLFWPVLRAACNAAWSMALVILLYPLGWLPKPHHPQGASCSGGLPPVLLTHGLYHNASAWLIYQQRLKCSGFGDVRTYSYPSFLRPFPAIVAGLVEAALLAAAASPTGTVLLVGHSLGGLVVRAACADATLRGRVAGIVTLGTPHRGSTLAGLLAVGRLGRGLVPGGEVLQRVRGLAVCPVPALSLFSPTDSMVLPLSGSFLEEREKSAGWAEACLAPVSHVGMLFDHRVAGRSAEFLLAAASRPTAP